MKNVLAIIAILGFSGFASAAVDAKYYEITSIETKEISHEVLYSPMDFEFPKLNEEVDPIDAIEAKLDQIINIGKKVWAIIELGRPVVDVKTDIATALPEGADTWRQLEGWAAPESRTYEANFKNAYGTSVVNFKYRVIYIYGGSVEGQGRYIGYATMVPVNIHVQYGFKLWAEATVPSVFNVGTKANPVGGMHMSMTYKIKTVMSHVEQSQAYYINGTGEFKKLD